MKQLSPWNPVDHLRLLWWLLVAPAKLTIYVELFGQNSVFSIGRWIASTLACLPVFLLTVSGASGRLPLREGAPSRTVFLWLSAAVFAVGLLLGLMRDMNKVLIDTSTGARVQLLMSACLFLGLPAIAYAGLFGGLTLASLTASARNIPVAAAIGVASWVTAILLEGLGPNWGQLAAAATACALVIVMISVLVVTGLEFFLEVSAHDRTLRDLQKINHPR